MIGSNEERYVVLKVPRSGDAQAQVMSDFSLPSESDDSSWFGFGKWTYFLGGFLLGSFLTFGTMDHRHVHFGVPAACSFIGSAFTR